MAGRERLLLGKEFRVLHRPFYIPNRDGSVGGDSLGDFLCDAEGVPVGYHAADQAHSEGISRRIVVPR